MMCVTLRRVALTFVLMMAVFCSLAASGAVAANEALVDQMVDAAKARGCTDARSGLTRVLCSRVIRVGVRVNYPGFGQLVDQKYTGYDVDVASAIAQRMQVAVEFVPVSPANRISKLVAGDVDMVVATMTHTVVRDRQIDFVRPHYFGSYTSVVGPHNVHIASPADLAKRTVCVPIGAASNIVFSRAHAQMLLYDTPSQLIDGLRFGICSLAAHDNTLFATPMADPKFAAKYEEKLRFFPSPWGIGVAEGAKDLSDVLGAVVAELYKSGKLISLADKNRVPKSFLVDQTARLEHAQCQTPDTWRNADCSLPPANDVENRTSIADSVVGFENWLRGATGIQLNLTMLKGQENLALFLDGLQNTAILIAGAITATVGFAMLFQAGLRLRSGVLRGGLRVIVSIFQSSPVVLLLLLGYYMVASFGVYNSPIAMAVSIVAIGLANGSFAALAMIDALRSMRGLEGDPPPTLLQIVRRARTQILGFVVNAARASAVASFIGTPELLSTLTDIASVSAEKQTTFGCLMVIYLGMISLVVMLAGQVDRLLDRKGVVS